MNSGEGNTWQTLQADFASQASGSAAITPAFTFSRIGVFVNFGTLPLGQDLSRVLSLPPLGISQAMKPIVAAVARRGSRRRNAPLKRCTSDFEPLEAAEQALIDRIFTPRKGHATVARGGFTLHHGVDNDCTGEVTAAAARFQPPRTTWWGCRLRCRGLVVVRRGGVGVGFGPKNGVCPDSRVAILGCEGQKFGVRPQTQPVDALLLLLDLDADDSLGGFCLAAGSRARMACSARFCSNGPKGLRGAGVRMCRARRLARM